jgi:hypothetical protein
MVAVADLDVYGGPTNGDDGSVLGRIVRMGRVASATPQVIVVLGAFFDDSGTHPDSPVVAIGGLLGTEA